MKDCLNPNKLDVKNIVVKFLSVLFLLLGFITNVEAQTSPFGEKVNWLSGYQKEISGETLTYYSAFPDFINQALLTRATDGEKAITWETQPVEKTKERYVYFRWVAAHSSGTSKGNRNFDLYINDQKVITFTTKPNHAQPNWSFANADSTRLTFVKLKNDAANDAHGLAYLRVPISRVKFGEPLRLKVVGQKQNSNDWYMTFKYAFKEHADLAIFPFLYQNGKQPLVVNVLHFGKKEKLQVVLNETENYNFELKDGVNTFEIPIQPVQTRVSLHVRASYAKKILADQQLTIDPVIFRELNFIHHSHTDIGYSHLQPEVVRIHNKNVADALNMIDKTKNYPIEARFKWNIESLWVVENYLSQADATQKERFFTAVRNGDISLSALYANILTGLSMPEELLHYTDYAQQLKQQYQLPITSAMASDIPGFNWAIVTALAKGGVKYFSSGPNYLGANNPDLGDRVGNFVKTWGDKPVWWESPSGKEKVLFWTAAKGYSSWHGNAPGAIFDNGAKKIAGYLDDLDATKYPFDMVQWRYNCVADNGPIDSTISDFVKQWNEKYASPKIVLNTTEKLFEKFEKKYGDQLQTVRGDITPYWEDGAASTANEEGMNRTNSLRLQQLTTLYSILNPQQYNTKDFADAWKNILLFHEHTWGAHNSISDPDSSFVTKQWEIKKGFMLTADQTVKQLDKQLMQNISAPNQNRVAVVNTLSWQRKGVVYLPNDFLANAVKDEFGKTYLTQKLADGRKIFIAEKLKPLSVSYFTATTATGVNNSQFEISDTTLSNGLISLNWDKQAGTIKKLENIEGYSFTDEFNGNGLNEYWYVPGRDPASAERNTQSIKKMENIGPLATTITFSSTAPGTKNLTKKFTLFAGDDRVFIENKIDKTKVREKEAVYFSFPFAPELTAVTADAGYGTLRYDKDQLPGSNRDFFNAKRWLDVSDADKGVQLMMIEPFMVSPTLVDERLLINGKDKKWRDTGVTTSNWFVYTMNNYWHTNYKDSQPGESSYHFVLKPHGQVKNYEQEKAAMEFNQPLLAFGINESMPIIQKSLFNLSNGKVVVTSITPKSTNEYIIRLFNPEATTQQTVINWDGIKASQLTNLVTNEIINADKAIGLVPFEVCEFLVKAK